MSDLRLAVRLFLADRWFTAVAVLSLALGIGANTAIFSLLDTLMLRPLPVRQPHQLVELLSVYPGEPRLNFFWWKHYEHYRDASTTFADLMAVSASSFDVRAGDGRAEAVDGETLIGMTGPLEIQVTPDVRVLSFTAGLGLLAGLLFGAAPAWHAFRRVPAAPLRASGPAADTRSRRRFGSLLVVAQVALSLVLVSAAALFAGHLSSLRTAGVGFDHRSVLLVTLDPEGGGLSRRELAPRYQELLARFATIPGVRSATLSAMTPISGAGAARFIEIPGVRRQPEEKRYVSLNFVAPGYFRTFGTPLLAGRDFEPRDESGARVAIVNDAMARRYFPDGPAIGGRFTFEGEEDTPYEIVGVAGDAKYQNLYDPAPPTIYLDALQDGGVTSSEFALRTDGAPMSVAAAMRRAVADVLPTIRIGRVTTLAAQVNASIVPERLIAAVSGLFGAVGALLAAVGLYGLLAFTVSRRTSEFAVRMALGATGQDVGRLVVRSALGLTAAGVLAGVPMAIWGRQVAAGLVQRLSGDAAAPIAAAAAMLVAVALLAAYVPARRAARTQPMDVLRQ